MKRQWLFIAAMVFSLVSVASLAASNNNNDHGIAVVNIRSILQKAPQVVSLREKLKKQFSPQENEILAAQKKLEQDLARRHKNAAVMSEEAKKKLDSQLLSEQQRLQKLQLTFQHNLLAAQSKAFQGFMSKVRGIISNIAKQKQFKLVLTQSSVAYSNGSMDITRDVLQALKKQAS